MSKNILIFIIIIIAIGAGIYLGDFSGKDPNGNGNNIEKQCEFNELIFYYLDQCSWCQKVKGEGTISKLEALGVKVIQVNANVGPVSHQFQGVPTFVINEKVYTGYKTFEELEELLGCQEEKKVLEETFKGEKGEEVDLINGEIALESGVFDDGLAHFYNAKISNGKTIYFFVVKDRAGIYRAAANACQVCFDSRMGFRQEGDYMVCNTCGNKYPLNKIATEKGGCNPGPINPNLAANNGQIVIQESELAEVANFF